MLSSARAFTLLLVMAGAALKGACSSMTVTISTTVIKVCEYGHVHEHKMPIDYAITEAEREWVARQCVNYCNAYPDNLLTQQGCLKTCVHKGHRYVLNEKIRHEKKQALIIAYEKIQKLEIITIHGLPDHLPELAYEPKLKSMKIAIKECEGQGDDCVSAAYTHRRRKVRKAERQLVVGGQASASLE